MTPGVALRPRTRGLGKTDNCQIAVTLSIANHAASLPIAYQLYLQEDWAGDKARRKKVRVPIALSNAGTVWTTLALAMRRCMTFMRFWR